MKKLLFLFLFCVTTFTFSQETETTNYTLLKTTTEEYNYISKGYKIQIESGLDMKKGYDVKPIYKNTFSINKIERSVAIKGLYRNENPESPCALLVETLRKDTGYSILFCVPTVNSDEEVLNKAFSDYYALSKQGNSDDSSIVYSWHYLNALSHVLSKAYVEK